MPKPAFTSVYKTVGDTKVTTDIYLPSATGARPVAIMIHGGAFMMGHSLLSSAIQIDECLARGWIVAAPNYRLCPQVDLYSGALADSRDHLRWIARTLSAEIAAHTPGVTVDARRIVAVGESAGGTLAEGLAFGAPDLPRLAALVDFYGAKGFRAASWDAALPALQPMFGTMKAEHEAAVRAEAPVPATGGVEDGGPGGLPRYAFQGARFQFVMGVLANGRMVKVCQPDGEYEKIDPLANVDASWPPTWIAHGDADTSIPLELSAQLVEKLRAAGVPSKLVVMPGEEHTFIDRMVTGSETWRLQKGIFDEIEELLRKL